MGSITKLWWGADWELASIVELNHLFSVEGISFSLDPGLISMGPFINLQRPYWSRTESPFDPFKAQAFDFLNGFQGEVSKFTNTFSAWAVHAGDVGAPYVTLPGPIASVPEPGSIALMGLGLVGLLSFGRRQRRR